MNRTKHSLTGRPAAFGVGVAVLLTFAGCASEADRPRAGTTFTPTDIYVAPPDLKSGVPVTDVYYYYPAWGVYYNNSRHQFSYLQGGHWVVGPIPPGLSINSIMASPSVRMNFSDSPTNHHAETSLKYPSNWKPSTTN